MAAVSIALTACTSIPRPPPAGGDAVSGRLALRVEPDQGSPLRRENASFELRGDPSDGQFDLSTPLGTVIARARWSKDEVLLATPQGETRYPDLPTLSREVLGTPIPVAALFDWLRARPWAGAPLQTSTETGKLGFAQLGWSIDLDGYDADGLIIARHRSPPETILRIRVDR